MELPDGRPLILADGILSEPSSGDGRLALWLPGERSEGFQHWQRVVTAARPTVHTGPGLRAVAATSVPARQRLTRKPFFGLGGAKAERTWTLPGGSLAEQCGSRQADLALAWAEDEAAHLDGDRLRSMWPGLREVRPIGADVYVVSGVDPERLRSPSAPEAGGHDADSPIAMAERALAAARRAGDARGIVTCRIDLGLARLRVGEPLAADSVLNEALAESRRLADRNLEADVLLNLAEAAILQNQPARAREVLTAALAIARETGDRYAEKSALDRLGSVLAQQGDHIGPLSCFEGALAIATGLADRRHEADLLWRIAIEHADQGRRPRAIASAQAAADIFRTLGDPRADWYLYHLSNYRSGQGDAAASLATAGVAEAVSRAPYTGGSIDTGGLPAQLAPSTGGMPTTGGPGLLRMASSAAKSMGTFVWSGFRTATAETARARLAVCSSCEHHTGVRCRICGCFTSAKARLLHEHCPAGKWPP